jgi:hypothetical protein
VLPRSVRVEGCRVRNNIWRQVLRRDTKPLIAPRLRPAIEVVPRRGIEHVRRGRPRAGARKCALARPHERSAVLVDQFGAATKHRELDLPLPLAADNGNPVLAGFRDLHPPAGRVDAIGHVTSPARDSQPQPALDQPQHFVGLKVDDGVVIDVECAAVGEQRFGPAALRTDSIAREQRHRAGRLVAATVPFESHGPLDE